MATFLFINDDLRDKYAKLYLKKKGHEILDYYIQNKVIDYIVLPIKGKEKDELFEHLVKENLDKKYIIYNETDYLRKLKNKYNLNYIYLKEDKEFNKINSLATSECVLMFSIEVLPIILKEASILILGYGNSAKELVNDYLHFTNNILVAVRRKEIQNELTEKNIKNININELKDYIEKYDLIINTIPSLIIDEELLRYISPSSYILDIASFPGGVDYKKAKEYGINAYLLPSLPSKFKPKSSGIEYAKAIERGIKK